MRKPRWRLAGIWMASMTTSEGTKGMLMGKTLFTSIISVVGSLRSLRRS